MLQEYNADHRDKIRWQTCLLTGWVLVLRRSWHSTGRGTCSAGSNMQNMSESDLPESGLGGR